MLTEAEKIILKSTNKRWRYIVRGSIGGLHLFEAKPHKIYGDWIEMERDIETFYAFTDIFQSVKWSDNEPLQFRDEKGEFLL